MVSYFVWWYAQEPAYLWHSLKNVSRKIFLTFSVPLLLKTLFDPWKRDVTYIENASLDVLFNIWIGNLVSRLVGFVIRIFTILSGIIIGTILFILLLIFFLIWLLAPLIIVYLVYNGFRIILNG